MTFRPVDALVIVIVLHDGTYAGERRPRNEQNAKPVVHQATRDGNERNLLFADDGFPAMGGSHRLGRQDGVLIRHFGVVIEGPAGLWGELCRVARDGQYRNGGYQYAHAWHSRNQLSNGNLALTMGTPATSI